MSVQLYQGLNGPVMYTAQFSCRGIVFKNKLKDKQNANVLFLSIDDVF